MSRRAWVIFAVIIDAVWMVSLATGYRASQIAGSPHYLLTRTSVPVLSEVPAENETDAALDKVFEEAGEDTRMTVDEPVFVLGILDAALPITLVGCGLMAALHVIARRRHRRSGTGVRLRSHRQPADQQRGRRR